MVDKISIEIGLEGGDEVTRQLEQMGQAGQKTFSGIQQAAERVDFSSISDGFEQIGSTGQEAFDKIKTAAKNAAVFEQIIQGVKKVEGAFERLGTAATKMAARMTRSLGPLGVFARALGPVGIAAAALGSLFIKAENDVSNSINGMVQSAGKLGVAVPEFDRLRQALLQTGVSADTIAPGLEQLKQTLSGEFFSVSLTTGMQNVIAQLERMPDGVERTALAFEKLGPALGAGVIAGLQTGTISASNFAATLAGITPVTQQQIVDAAKYQQAVNGLSNAWTTFKNALAGPVAIPALEWLAGQLPAISAGIATTVREFQALGSAINTVATAGAAVINALVEAVKSVGTAIADVITTLGGWNWSIIDAGVAAWNALTGAIQAAINKVLQFMGLKPSAPATGGGAPGKASGGLLGGRGTGTSDSNLAWLSRGEYIMPARAVRQPGVLSFLEAMRRSGGIPGYAEGGPVGGGFPVSQFISSLGGAIGRVKDIWEAINNGIQGVNESLAKAAKQNTQVAQTAEQSLRQLQITLATILGDLVSAAQGNARGGLLGGRGTGTSDSNLAWVSRGEYITPARAVQQPGVLSFLEALRRSGGNLSRVLDGMGRFALGGLVPRMPAYAAGGLAGGNNVTIQFPGLPAIGGLRASSSVVDQLQKAAALAQVRSGGRKPSRYS